MTVQSQTAILFVCLGNICRSPLAEGIFRAVIAERGLSHAFRIESAALGDWHVGDPPDARSVAVARRNGIDISGQRARRITVEDFLRFDLIFGMDRTNVTRLRQLAPRNSRDRIHLFLEYALASAEEIADPYYGSEEDFIAVYGRIREGSEAMAEKLAVRAGSARSRGQASSTT
ncbi:low molecular weight protein-tyrosine-phosphatase [Chelativorans sp. Marseille-P2723]|uniref:low molecular weight protein-tyrosine-phosphatase n=1 Tax=Chelativorans sp. Marseille-P2723 TaxID=2709133 RepID=UPI00157073CD|nr:low molecular weight protein-tyrosine-phosphatase [Chelativorans sp. Marseille-P2723]